MNDAVEQIPKFFLHEKKGVLLPEDEKLFEWVFKSHEPGIFTESWQFQAVPKLDSTCRKVTLTGMCATEDHSRVERAKLDARLQAGVAQETMPLPMPTDSLGSSVGA